MDDLDRAVLLIYDPSAGGGGIAAPSLRSQAVDFCHRLKSGPPSALIPLCFDRLRRSPFVPVQFWCLQSLHEIIIHRYSALSADDLSLLRSSLLSLFSDRPLPSASPPFLRNKLAQTLAALIRLEYPSPWPSPFLHLLSFLPGSADKFCSLLAALHDDLFNQDYHHSQEDSSAAARVKDAMRVQCVPQIARAWFDVVSLYSLSEPVLAVTVLDTMRHYIPWIDIGLVANDVFLPLLFDLILYPDAPGALSAAAVGCVVAIFSKRMDPRSKLSLLESLNMSRIFSERELFPKLAGMITSYASEALDCYKRLASEYAEASSSSMELLEDALPSVFYVMQRCGELDSGNVVQFLSDYLSTMKSPLHNQMVYIGQILEVIRAQISYDPAYRSNLDIPDKIGIEEEERMGEHRKEFFTLFRSVCRVAPVVTQSFVRNLITGALTSSEMNVEQVEAALTLFYRLGEMVNEEGIKSGSVLLGEMVPVVLSAKFACHSHRVVAVAYLETITKHMKLVQENSQYIPNVLAAFLDERGIHHPNISVSTRAGYLFLRAVKLLKANLVPFIDTILQNAEDILARYIILDWTSMDLKCPDDGSHTFEAIGLLIGMDDVLPEKQTEYLAKLLKPLCQQVEAVLLEARAQGLDESSLKVTSLQQIIVALIALSKGFSERTVTASRPVIGVMFKQTLDVLLQILVAFPNAKPLRSKITSFIHRMVEILGTSVFPYLPMAFNRLLLDTEPRDAVDFLVLINQVICKFGSSFESILGEIFPTIASRLFGILSTDDFFRSSGCNTEEIRELQEFQRTLCTFLHVIVTHDLSSVFIAPHSRGYLDAMMQLLLLISCSYKDVIVRKMCVQIFVKLIKDWCKKHKGEEKVPGFGSFIIEKFATNCCLFSVLDVSLDLHDANTLILLGEIVLALKAMYEKLGDEYLIHFISKGLLAAHCPQDLAEQFYTNVQHNDIKALKSFYLSLVENLRQHQNGSLVFR